MPYIQVGSPQRKTSLPGIRDVYSSKNVFVNFVPVALWQNPQGPAAFVIQQITSPTFPADSAATNLEETDTRSVEVQQQALVTAGIYKPEEIAQGNNPTVSRGDNTAFNPVPAKVSEEKIKADIDPDQTEFPDSYKLSKNFTLGGFTKAPGTVFTHQVAAQAGLSLADIVANLKLLAQNCAEPVRKFRPDFVITNSFRSASSSSATSQHPKGQAMDFQFAQSTKAEYFEIAQWMKNNIPFDQLILEYKTTGSRQPWIHVSFNGKGNRNQVLTFMNNKRYSVGLTDLSST
jgi:hypothetical protein